MTPKAAMPEGAARPAPALLTRALRRGGIDRAVGFTLLGRGWTALSGLLTLVLMTRFLTGVQQGYYFTFGSVLALTVFFELGLSLVLVQFASHERASLDWTPAGTLEGDPAAKARLASLLRMSVKWYSAAALLLIAVILPAGMVFFGRHPHPGVVWQTPWVWITLVTGLTIAQTPLLAVLEGCGLIAQIARLQLCQNIAGSLLLWLALTTHWGLFAAPVTNTVSLLCLLAWLWLRKRSFFRDLLRRPAGPPSDVGLQCDAGHRIDWRREVWPLQWKIALSYISGYFIAQLFNPILFATHGPVAAGQMGLSLTVIGTVSTISLAWVATKAATFGTLIARKDYAGLDRLFFPCLWQSWILVGLGCAAVCGAALALHLGGWPISRRFLAPLPLGLLALAAIANHGVFAQAVYLRAHKQEPFLLLSLCAGAGVAFFALALGKPFGATGMMAGYAAVCTLALILGTFIFVRLRGQWHEKTSKKTSEKTSEDTAAFPRAENAAKP